MLSDSPPDRDVIWTEAGRRGRAPFRAAACGAWSPKPRRVSKASPQRALRRVRPARSRKAAHKTLKLVGDDIGKLGFNKAVARIYELSNALQAPLAALASGSNAPGLAPALREALEFLVVMIAPMMPHLAEECWAALGGKGFVADQPWPQFDPALIVDSEITYPVQVNGKKRGELTIARDADEAAVDQAPPWRSTSCRRRSKASRRARSSWCRRGSSMSSPERKSLCRGCGRQPLACSRPACSASRPAPCSRSIRTGLSPTAR